MSHYGQVLIAGREVEEWLCKQEKGAQTVDDQYRGLLHNQLDDLSHQLYEIMAEVL